MTALVPTAPFLHVCYNRQGLTLAIVVEVIEEHFGVLFILVSFVVSDFFSEVDGRVGHRLVLAWFKLCTRETFWYLFCPRGKKMIFFFKCLLLS